MCVKFENSDSYHEPATKMRSGFAALYSLSIKKMNVIRNLDPIYTVTAYSKWVKTFWTYSIDTCGRHESKEGEDQVPFPAQNVEGLKEFIFLFVANYS